MVLLNMREGFLFFFCCCFSWPLKLRGSHPWGWHAGAAWAGVRKRGNYSTMVKTWKVAQGEEWRTPRKFRETSLRALTLEISSFLVPAIEITFSELHTFFGGGNSSYTELQLPAGPAMSGVCPTEMHLGHFKGGVFFYAHPQPNVHSQRWLRNGLRKVISNIDSHYWSICRCKNTQHP